MRMSDKKEFKYKIVSVRTFKNQLSKLLHEVEKGTTVFVTKRGSAYVVVESITEEDFCERI